MENLVIKYLQNNNYHQNVINNFKENYFSHPNYPSLFSVTDSLGFLGIENFAVSVPKEHFRKLPEIFIASVLLDNKTEFVLIKKKEKDISYENQNGQILNISFDEFKIFWDGVILVIEENETKENSDSSFRRNKMIRFIIPLILLFFVGFLNLIDTQMLFLNYITFLLLSMIGLMLSFFIIQESLGEVNPFVSKICNSSNKNIACDFVVKSKESKFFFAINFSDLPIVFFLSNLLLISLKPSFFIQIGFSSLLSVPVIIYSIYLQKFKVRKWCVLCLGVSVILLLQAMFFLISYKQITWNIYNYSQYFIITIIIWLIWKAVEKALVNKNKMVSKNTILSRFKRKFEVFEFLLNNNSVSEDIQTLNGIIINKQLNPIKLRLFLSPSCGHCYTIYKEGIKLAKKYPEKITIEILFNVNIQNTENPFISVVESLHEIFISKKEDILNTLDDWYLKEMTLENWLRKWKQTQISTTTRTELEKQHLFCVENDLRYTPIIILGKNMYPDDFVLEELKYFISDLEEKNG
ncbi:vitamin K epoxide reductase family protein [Flavobacterium sp. xlx-214]|uniref:vitamin K epoxide reductase family protein n=1 Tax=unclassified Flavobacterium TaxID=196869 RepID=UPI0013D6BEE2|nr:MULTISPECIES: vitamin K epoxide reductase family protein [unclassified Flavobacterium]MBA5793459.1 vitamin K epoxide reductase family protein [Flavobacterium sp. xlx-221]QMI82769.1 vitamin K epoxide reductase family protein [Flavobacterium sp. xlx-214]